MSAPKDHRFTTALAGRFGDTSATKCACGAWRRRSRGLNTLTRRYGKWYEYLAAGDTNWVKVRPPCALAQKKS